MTKEPIIISDNFFMLYTELIEEIANYKKPAWNILIAKFQQIFNKILSSILVIRILHLLEIFLIKIKQNVPINITSVNVPKTLRPKINPSSYTFICLTPSNKKFKIAAFGIASISKIPFKASSTIATLDGYNSLLCWYIAKTIYRFKKKLHNFFINYFPANCPRIIRIKVTIVQPSVVLVLYQEALN